jgi:hypothetical protein
MLFVYAAAVFLVVCCSDDASLHPSLSSVNNARIVYRKIVAIDRPAEALNFIYFPREGRRLQRIRTRHKMKSRAADWNETLAPQNLKNHRSSTIR